MHKKNSVNTKAGKKLEQREIANTQKQKRLEQINYEEEKTMDTTEDKS